MNHNRSAQRWRTILRVLVCLSLGLAPFQLSLFRSSATLFEWPVARAAGGVQLLINPTAITVAPGQVFTLQVSVQAEAQPIDGAEAHLDFNPAFVRVRALTPGTTLATILENKFDNTSGTIDYAAGTLVKPRPSGTFVLAQIELEALAVTPGISVAFHFGVPRNSEVTFEGASVLGGTVSATVLVQQGGAASPSAPFATPTGGQSIGARGGIVVCAQWTVTIPAGVAPDGSTVHCGAFNPNVAPLQPGDYQLLRHTINIHLYNNWGSWITTFNTPLTVCYPYGDSDLNTASGKPDNLVILTAPVGGAWSALTTTANPSTGKACASVNHLTLFDLSVRVTAAPSGTYTVRLGDTLFRIALRFRTTVAALRAANQLTSNSIYPGQVLVIPSGAASPSTSASSPTLRTDPIAPGRYIVQEGDTLFRIALRAGTTVATLQAINGLASNYLQVGQELIIPASSGIVTNATPVPVYPRTYVVRPGDNVFRIALNYGVTVAALTEANGLTTTRIDIGQVLIIPGP